MEVIVISSKEKFKSEVTHVIGMFELGLDSFHLRKPKFSYKRMADYINEIPEKYHNRIVIHSYHTLAKKYNLKGIHYTKRHKKKKFKNSLRFLAQKLFRPKQIVTSSCHDLFSLKEYSEKYEYIFLSPIFDSISKGGHHAGFSLGTIRKNLRDCKANVFALGGIEADKIEQARKIGFKGVALLGCLWNTDRDPVKVYQEIIDIAEERTVYSAIANIKTVKIEL